MSKGRRALADRAALSWWIALARPAATSSTCSRPWGCGSRTKAVGHALQADASWQATRNVKLQVDALHQEVDVAVKRSTVATATS